MNKIGIVTELSGTEAKVRIQRPSACGENCASCKAGCVPTENDVWAVNEAGAKTGDKVELEMQDKRVLLAAALVYIIPLCMLFVGYAIGGIFFAGEEFKILSGFLLMGICYAILSIMDKHLKSKYSLIIKKVL